jgi:hypothetical protein
MGVMAGGLGDKDVEGVVDAVREAYCNSFDPITDSSLSVDEATENIIFSALETLLQHGLANPQGVQRVLLFLQREVSLRRSFSTSEQEHDEHDDAG